MASVQLVGKAQGRQVSIKTHTASSSSAAGDREAPPAGREGLKRTVSGRPKRGFCDLSTSSHEMSWL